MLVFRGRGLFGLGLTPAQRAAQAGTFDPTLINSGGSAGAYDPAHAGGFTIQQHTWDQVVNEVIPGWISDTLFNTSIAYWLHDAWLTRVRAATAGLPGCPTGAITDNNTSCYFGRFTPLATWNPNDPIEILPPGVFAVYGIPFTVDELVNGRFTKTLIPTAIQRREAEWAIIKKSMIRMFGKFQILNRTDMDLGDRFNEASVDEMLAAVPDLMLFSINFERNPIQPTPTERTTRGGFKAWIARGGYPLSRAVVTGKDETSDAIGIQVCTGMLCACPAGSGFPSCVPAAFNKSGIGSTPSEGSFYPYVAIPQDAVKPEIQLTLVHNDPSWITKVGNIGEKLMRIIGDALCANQGITQEQLKKQMASEVCVDAAKKPCAKGSPGCTCTKDSASTSGSKISAYVVWDVAMAKFCPGWIADMMPDPLTQLPPVDPNPPIPEPPKKIPWWAVVGGGLLVGAAALSFLGPAKQP